MHRFGSYCQSAESVSTCFFATISLLSFLYFMPPLEQLSDEAVEVLYVLWMERFRTPFLAEGLTPDEIRERTDYPSTNPIYAAIKELNDRADRWRTLAEVNTKANAPGKRPRSYVLYGDGVSEWPRSSFFLMELNAFDKKRPRQIDAADFCQHLLDNCAFQHQDDLDAIVVGLCSLDYLYRSPSLPTLATKANRRGYSLLALNERTRMEQEFIKKVALHYPVEVEETGGKLTLSGFLANEGYDAKKQK
jgi:hypothetical protein